MNREDKKVFNHVRRAIGSLDKKEVYSKGYLESYVEDAGISISNMSSVLNELMKRGYAERLGDDNYIITKKC